MPGEVKIEIQKAIAPSFLDWLFGTEWHWAVFRGPAASTAWRYGAGFARTEKGARRKAEEVARQIQEGTVRYTYKV